MKVNVQIYGTSNSKIVGYSHDTGIDVETADGSDVRDIIAALGIEDTDRMTILRKDELIRRDTALRPNDSIVILENPSGG